MPSHATWAPWIRRDAALVGALALALGGCAPEGDGVRGSGTIELDEVDVSSLVGGRVSEIRVVEGDSVRAGDTLVVIDRGEVLAELQAQAAQAAQAAAQARELSSGYRVEDVEQARAALADAEATFELAEADWVRADRLFQAGAIAKAEHDRAQATRDQTLARRDAAAEKLRQMNSGYRREEVRAASEGAEAARAQLSAARSRARELVLTAPISGVVLLKNFDRGELAPASTPIVTLGNPDALWMRAYIAAPKIEAVRLGAAAEIRVRRDGPVYHGRVVEIATRAEFTPRAALTAEERANLVFGVKVAIEASGGALKPGLPADVRILTSPAVAEHR